jgi:predicted phage baseplate assembly protein
VPLGRDNVIARRYQTGGGDAGNVAAGSVAQLLAALPFVSGVTNPVAAEGGSDAETLAAVRDRGPGVLRHRGRALAVRDYEALAREASAAVAVARAVPATGPDGRAAAGWVRLVIMPKSRDPRPQPSPGLCAEVQAYVAARAPADLAGLDVVGPDFWPVGANLTVVPVELDDAGPVGVAARQAVTAFLHPLTGGPDGRGWPPGRGVFLSDLAVAVATTPGLDHATELELTLDAIPQGEQVSVPADKIVVAGDVRVVVRSPDSPCGT